MSLGRGPTPGERHSGLQRSPGRLGGAQNPWLLLRCVSPQGCLIAALILFHGLAVHPIVLLIVTMELSIFIFFIILYSFAIQRYMAFILWPITVSEGRRGGLPAGALLRVWLSVPGT